MENENGRILALWKMRIPIFLFFFLSENSRFVENGNWRILVLENQNWRIFFFFYPRILVFRKRRILFLRKTGTREFSFCGKPESENFFFFSSENSRFVENGNWRFLVLWKTRIGEFFFFYPRVLVLWKTGTGEFSFCGKPESENLFFFSSSYPTILVLWKTGTGEFSFWKTRIGEFFFFFIREFSFCGNGEFSF